MQGVMKCGHPVEWAYADGDTGPGCVGCDKDWFVAAASRMATKVREMKKAIRALRAAQEDGTEKDYLSAYASLGHFLHEVSNGSE